MSERAVEIQRDSFLCFIDYQKAFNTVSHEQLLRMLVRLEVYEKDLIVIKNLYYQHKAAVRMGGELTETVNVKGCDRQGCVLSLDIFILYGEIIMRKIEGKGGFSIGGRNVNNVRYANLIVLIADLVQKLQALFDVVNRTSEGKGLNISRVKT